MKLSKIQSQRWDAAKKLFRNIKKVAKENELVIMFDGQVIGSDNIVQGKDSINIIFSTTNYEMFYANPEYDHGLDSTIEEFAEEIRARIRLYKEFQY